MNSLISASVTPSSILLEDVLDVVCEEIGLLVVEGLLVVVLEDEEPLSDG